VRSFFTRSRAGGAGQALDRPASASLPPAAGAIRAHALRVAAMAQKYEQVGVVIRLDLYNMKVEDPTLFIKVHSVLPTFKNAESEARRLNAGVDPAKVLYFAQVTHWFPEGRASQTRTE
jgi:hypothetical protein